MLISEDDHADPPPSSDIRERFGDIDIYLFDQLARGRFDQRRCVLDAGCGAGRNLRYLLAHGYDCHGIDRDSGAIAQLRRDGAGFGVTLGHSGAVDQGAPCTDPIPQPVFPAR